MATVNGHTSIVNLLISSGADANAKNDDNLTALDIAASRGFFETCKSLIDHTEITDHQYGNSPLHFAAREGAHDLVKSLLKNGATIDKRNNENLNCLDIAIKNGHREVIRALLDDKNWFKLIRFSNQNMIEIDEECDDFKIVVIPEEEAEKLPMPEGTLVALYNQKMWDILKIILDKCKKNENETNFSIIDVPTKYSEHTLMLIARSGDEDLITHQVTSLLVNLKWRSIPRFVFYFNLFLYFLFLFMFSWYAIELSWPDDLNEPSVDNFEPNQNISEKNIYSNLTGSSVVLFRSRGFKMGGGSNRFLSKKLDTNSSENILTVNI